VKPFIVGEDTRIVAGDDRRVAEAAGVETRDIAILVDAVDIDALRPLRGKKELAVEQGEVRITAPSCGSTLFGAPLIPLTGVTLPSGLSDMRPAGPAAVSAKK